MISNENVLKIDVNGPSEIITSRCAEEQKEKKYMS